MINSSLKDAACNGTNIDLTKRLEVLEKRLDELTHTFSSDNIYADNLEANTSDLGRAKAVSLNATAIDTGSLTTRHIDVTGPVAIKDLSASGNISSTGATFDKVDTGELNSTSVTADTANIKNLKVGQITSTDNNMSVVDLTVNGVASVNKLNLGDPNVDSLNLKTLEAKTANIDSAFLTHIDGVEDANVATIRLDKGVVRGDSVQTNVVKLLGSTAMQVGDKENQVVLTCDSRPLWNDKVLAILDDLGDKIVPAYKGRLATEADLPTTGTVGDYYIITLLTKESKTGIGFALYNGVEFDTDFFYELDGYRLAADQDIIDDGQNVAITNEIARAKGKEDDIFNNGVRKVQAKAIAGNNLNIDLLFGAEHFGERYTGFGKDFIDGAIPAGEENVGCSIDILPNSHNTVQIMTTNHPTEARVFIRSFGNKTWTEWQKVAYVADKVADSERLEGKTLLELRQLLFDDAHPVKDTFVSNDGADDPNTIYNINGITSTWTYVGQSFGIHGWRRTK